MRTIITKDFLKSVKSLEDIQFEVKCKTPNKITKTTKITINGFSFPPIASLNYTLKVKLCSFDSLDHQSKIDTIREYINECLCILSDEYCDSSDTKFISQLRRVCELTKCGLLHDFKFEDGILPKNNMDGSRNCCICLKPFQTKKRYGHFVCGVCEVQNILIDRYTDNFRWCKR